MSLCKASSGKPSVGLPMVALPLGQEFRTARPEMTPHGPPTGDPELNPVLAHSYSAKAK